MSQNNTKPTSLYSYMIKIVALMAFIWLGIASPASATDYYTESAVANGVRPYQMNLTLSNATGSNNASFVYLNGHAGTNFSSVYFQDATTGTNYNYCVEDNFTGRTWVNVTLNGTVKMFYGNLSRTSTANCSATFLYSSAFDTGTTLSSYGYTINAGSATVSEGMATLAGNSIARTNLTFGRDTAVRTRSNFSSGAVESGYQGYAGGTGRLCCGFAWEASGMQHDAAGNNRATDAIDAVTFTSDIITLATVTNMNTYDVIRNGSTSIIYAQNDILRDTITTTMPTGSMSAIIGGFTGGQTTKYDWLFVRNYTFPEPAFTTWSSQTEITYIPIFASNTTRYENNSLISMPGASYSIVKTIQVTDSYIGTARIRFQVNDLTGLGNPCVLPSSNGVNGTAQCLHPGGTYVTGSQDINVTIPIGQYIILYGKSSAFGTGNVRNFNVSFDYDYANATPPTLISPANNSVIAFSTLPAFADVTFTWSQIVDSGYNIQIAQDSNFSTMEYDVSTTVPTTTKNLPTSSHHYWRVRTWNAGVGGNWSSTFNFAMAESNGSLNITVQDEMTFANVTGLNITLYNSTASLTKLNSTGYWINFTSAEVSNGVYLAYVQATGYYSRYYLLSSPGNYTLYLANGSSTVSNYTFVLLDYTNDFPFSTTRLIISKFVNNTEIIISSNYFDVAALGYATLINGQQYRLTVQNNNTSSVRILGNLIPSGSATMNLLVSDLEFRPGANLNNLTQIITYNSNVSIVLTWTDPNSEIISQNFTIFNTTWATVYQTVTSVHIGQSTYTLVNNQKLYVCLNTSTVSFGNLSTCNWYNPGLPGGTAYTGLNMSISQDAKNFASMFILFCFAYLYGRRDVMRGALYVSLLSILVWITQWLVISNNTTTGAILIPLLIVAIIANLSERER